MKKKSLTRACAVIMALAMTGSLAACGGGDTTESTTAADGAGTTAAGGSTETTAAGGSEETTAAEAEETYDFGGAVIRVNGGHFGDLNPDNEGNASYVTAWDAANQVEQKYNVKFEYVNLEGDDGYSTTDAILAGITNGECFADLFYPDDAVFLGLRDYLADITDSLDELKIGSLYTEGATWRGHTYGWVYDNIGEGYALVYSRAYLDSIGMDKTPTDLFAEGKWSYDDVIEYLTELKSKLPDGTYPISVHPWHWASMACAANGYVSVDSDGNVNLAEEGYASALEFYKQLLQLGLACPIECEVDAETGGIGVDLPYDTGDGLARVGAPGQYVITNAEAWQMEGLQSSIGDWGLVPYPWDSNFVTCDGDYTTLSDNYKTAQSRWGCVVTPKAEYRGAGAKDIQDIVLHKIAMDYIDLKAPAGATARHAMWEAEKNGEAYVNRGYNPDAAGNYSTTLDRDIRVWMCSRAAYEWGNSMQSNGLVRVNRNASYIIGNGDDARSSGESYKASGEQALKDQGLK